VNRPRFSKSLWAFQKWFRRESLLGFGLLRWRTRPSRGRLLARFLPRFVLPFEKWQGLAEEPCPNLSPLQKLKGV
jgi:hypothetical protein